MAVTAVFIDIIGGGLAKSLTQPGKRDLVRGHARRSRTSAHATTSPAATTSPPFSARPWGEPSHADSSTEAVLLTAWQMIAGTTLPERSVTSPR